MTVAEMREICAEVEFHYTCLSTWPSGALGTFVPETTGNLTVAQFIGELERTTTVVYDWTVVGDQTLSKNDLGARSSFVADASSASSFAFERAIDPFPRGAAECTNPDTRGCVPCELGPDVVKVQRRAPQHLLNIWDRTGAAFVAGSTIRFEAMGTGVIVYVIDGNVMPNDEFSDLVGATSRLSREGFFSTSAENTRRYACGADHGTHVASLVAGISYGVGKNVTIVPVAVQPGCSLNGRLSDLTEGLAWVLEDVLSRPSPRPPIVATMSLQLDRGDPASAIIDSLVQDLIAEGVVMVAAAGNYFSDACDFSPSGIDNVITIGALDANQPWTSSNFGDCVDFWAPGVEVVGAAPDCFRCTAAFTGTSQAAPIVAGLVATYLEAVGPSTVATVKRWLLDNAITLDDIPSNTTIKAAKYPHTYTI